MLKRINLIFSLPLGTRYTNTMVRDVSRKSVRIIQTAGTIRASRGTVFQQLDFLEGPAAVVNRRHFTADFIAFSGRRTVCVKKNEDEDRFLSVRNMLFGWSVLVIRFSL